MVVDFNKDKKKVANEKELEEILERARQGDISSVMGEYEKEIRHPISGALFGELVRLLLIQVQKQKGFFLYIRVFLTALCSLVDVEKAMLQIDKLLQANELNFTILAAIPGIIFVLFLGYLYGRAKKTTREAITFAKMREYLRDISILLNKNYNKKNEQNEIRDTEDLRSLALTPLEYGRLMILIKNLRHGASKLKSGQTRAWFLHDLEELENPHYEVNQRLITVQRMFSSYPWVVEEQ